MYLKFFAKFFILVQFHKLMFDSSILIRGRQPESLLVTAEYNFGFSFYTVADTNQGRLVSIARELVDLVDGVLIAQGSPLENTEVFRKELTHNDGFGMHGLNFVSSKDIKSLMVERGFNVYPLGPVSDVDECLAKSFETVNSFFYSYYQQRGDNN